jgi:hypothetical protein
MGFNEERDGGFLEREAKRVVGVLLENDLWMVGVVVYRLLMGRFPFSTGYDESEEDSSEHGT